MIYFYNVYGPRQIKSGKMATVIGIFENQYKNKKPLTVVMPGTQTRRFTHIDDTVNTCFEAWKKNRCELTLTDSVMGRMQAITCQTRKKSITYSTLPRLERIKAKNF